MTMKWWLAVTFAALSSLSATAQDVTLTARDGTLTLDGRLLGYDGQFLRLQTEYGEVTVDGTRVDCAGAACPDPDDFVAMLRVSGSAAVGDILLPALIETFAVRNGYDLDRVQPEDGSDVTFELRRSGVLAGALILRLSSSDEGFADLIADESDLVISRREISRDEAVLAREAGRGVLTEPGRSRILALDGIVPAVAIQNGLEAIPFEALRSIVRGEITEWSDLGGTPGPIDLHLADPGSGLVQSFLSRVAVSPDDAFRPGVVVHPDDRALAAAVSADPRALGLAAFSSLGNVQPLALTGACGQGSEADTLSLKSEDYPLTAPIFLYVPMRRLPPLAREFLAYALSPAAQPVIRRAGFVDQFPQAITLEEQGRRLAFAIERAGRQVSLADLQNLVETMTGKVRLSLSFRFEGGSSLLDAQSRSNVALLAQAIDRGVFDGRRLTFAGFTDGAGAAAANRALSRRRADVVRDAVEARMRNADRDITLETAAFGEALPMACDRSDWGARVNRRVEIWLD